ncbi:CdaR family transcriptional regulator [Nocardiopsis sp. YSL2]|uniref:PucR family transcriptional regulator n=1 Tax=Nocardiopsis sp. YSL2 TaxID=2939492 RepID=UPI0026F4434F|nr:PucR family transcriptional regulator [Nocardiopsis sp. YSL2]
MMKPDPSELNPLGGLGFPITQPLAPVEHWGTSRSFVHGGYSVTLIPVTESAHPEALESLIAQASAWIEATGERRCAAFGSATGHNRIGTTVDDLEMVIRVVERLGYSPGVYRTEDIPIEIALMRSPDLAELLAGRLVPLTLAGAPLMETLLSYLEHGRERANVARQLHIHPNTLDYRLRRIHELTGLSPWLMKDIQILGAASIAARLSPENEGRCHTAVATPQARGATDGDEGFLR